MAKTKKLSKELREKMLDLTESSYELHGQNKNCDWKECDTHKN